MIIVNKVYIDICDNFRFFLRLNNKRLNKNKIRGYYLYIIYKILRDLNFVSNIKIRRKKYIIIYSNSSKKIINIIERLLKNQENVVLSRDILMIIKNADSKNIELQKFIEKCANDKINFYKNIEEVLLYTFKTKKIAIEQSKIYILIKKYDYIFEEHIKNIAKICNTVNIVTPNICQFRRLESIIDDMGGMITISNNKRKSVAKAMYLINLDYNEKDINKYNLGRDAIIFNLSRNKIYNLKGFSGNIINNADMIEKDHSLSRMIDRRLGIIYDKNIRIFNLVGNNGKINNI